jgi:hypothetical protein
VQLVEAVVVWYGGTTSISWEMLPLERREEEKESLLFLLR